MKNAIKCTCFTLIVILIMTYISSVLSFKNDDGAYIMTKFYDQEEDTVDVLVLGSSHAFMDINPAILWNEYGIAAYDVCAGYQPMWSSYYYLVEALKTQHPRLIVLEGYCLYPRDTYDKLVVIGNNYGLKWSPNRVDALRAGTLSWEFMDYLLPLNQTHNRYADLSEGDFRSNKGDPQFDNWKGFVAITNSRPYERRDLNSLTESAELDDKIETYYRKILELAQSEDIPIAVVISPYATITDESQAAYNRAGEIAAEYGVSYYNYNLGDDICGLDYATDIAEEGSHLNHLGSAKYTKALGKYLIENYPEAYVDRRGDARYTSWERNAAYYERTMYNMQIEQAEDIPTAIALANDENYTVLLSVSQENEDTTSLSESLQNIGINLDAQTGAWIITGGTNSVEQIQDFPRHLEPMVYDDLLITADGNHYTYLMNNEDYTTVDGGTNLLIYDKTTARIVTTMGY